MTATVANVLTEVERSELAEAEAVIEHGLQTFVEVGEALAKVRDARLYRAEFGTFEDYCRERWGLSGDMVHKTIRASAATRQLSSAAPDAPLPTNEGQARELSGLEPEQAAKVMRETHKATGGNVTAAAIRRIRAGEPETFTCDACHTTYGVEHLAMTTPNTLCGDCAKNAIAAAEEAAETPDVQAQMFMSNFLRAVRSSQGLTAFDADRVADLADESEMGMLTGHLTALTRWVDKVRKRRSGLRVIAGGDSQ